MRATIILSMLAASPAVAAAGPCQLGKLAELPVTMRGMQPTVPATINGQQVYFLADSGAPYNLISPGAAGQLGLRVHAPNGELRMKGIGGSALLNVTVTETMNLGGLDLTKTPFYVGGSEIGQGSVGVLGQNLLGAVDAEYDLANGIIRLLQPHGCGEQSLAYWANGKPLPVQMLRIENTPVYNKHVIASVLVNGVKLRAVFDTGASTSVLTRAAAAKAGIKPDGPGVRAAGYGSGFGAHIVQAWIAPLASFKLGDEEIRSTRIRIEDLSDVDFDMLVGADFFLSHHVFVSNSQHRLYATYNGGPVFRLDKSARTAADASGAQAETGGEASGAEPADAEGYSRRGAARLSRRDTEAAVGDFDRAIQLAPAEPRYLVQRAEARLALRQPLRAKADLDAALKLHPGDLDALTTRARMYLRDGDIEAARADAQAAAKAAPRESDARLEIAGLLDAARAPDLAIPEFTTWLDVHKVDSKRPVALNGRCWARARAGRELAQAIDDCNTALRERPGNPSYLDSRGLARLRAGDLQRAIADYDAALAVAPKLAWPLYGRGLAKLRSGNEPDGRKDIAAALAIAPRLTEDARRYGIIPADGEPR